MTDPAFRSRPWAKFTDEQLRAALLVDRSLIASAGAGSGKTSVMAVRYVACLLDRDGGRMLTPDRILAITFTKEAAGNLRVRMDATIRAALATGQFPQPGRGAESAKEYPLDDEQAAHLRSCLADLPSAPIATFDSFCLELVASHASILARDPDLEPADDLVWLACTESSWLRLRREVLADEPDCYAELVEAYGEYAVKHRIIALANQAATTATGAISIEDSDPIVTVRKLRAREVGELEAAVRQLKAADGKWSALRDAAPAASAEFAAWCAELDGVEARGKAKEFVKGVQDALDFPSLRDEKGSRPGPTKRYGRSSLACLAVWDDDFERRCRKRAHTVAEMAMRFNRIHQEEVESRGHAGFARIEAEALALISDQRVRRDLGRRFRHVLLDESQDFNRLQAAFIEGLRAEKARIFAVGDHRQSIYGFRHAAPELFEEWQRRDPGSVARLSENFRSHPVLVDGVKGIFAQEALAKAFVPEHIRSGRRADSFAGQPRLDLWYVENKDPNEPIASGQVAGSQFQAAHIAQLIRDNIVAGKSPSDHAILLRSRSRMRIYAQALERCGIAYDADFPGGLYDSQECHDIEAILRLAGCPNDRFAFAVAVGGPWGTDDPQDKSLLVRTLGGDGDLAAAVRTLPLAEILPEVHARCANEGVASAIRWLAAHPRLCKRYGTLPLARRRLANLALLADEESEAGRPLDLAAFIERLDQRRRLGVDAREASGASLGDRGVRLMTIHGSKGLEWPVVFVPDCDKYFPLRELSSIAISVPVDDQSESIRVACAPGTNEDGDSIARILLKTRLHERLLAEEARLLYVACTRAGEQLHLSIAGEGKPSADQARNYSDWLIASSLPWTSVEIDLTAPSTKSVQISAPATPLPALRREVAGFGPDIRSVTELCAELYRAQEASMAETLGERAKTLGTALHEGLCRFGPGMSEAQARSVLAPFVSELPADRLARLQATLNQSDLVPDYWTGSARLSEQSVTAQVDPTRLLSGICDLLVKDARGAWHLYDYKSGHAAGHEVSRLQVLCYARMLRTVLDGPLSSAWLIDLETARRLEVRLDEKQEEQAWKRLLAAWPSGGHLAAGDKKQAT